MVLHCCCGVFLLLLKRFIASPPNTHTTHLFCLNKVSDPTVGCCVYCGTVLLSSNGDPKQHLHTCEDYQKMLDACEDIPPATSSSTRKRKEAGHPEEMGAVGAERLEERVKKQEKRPVGHVTPSTTVGARRGEDRRTGRHLSPPIQSPQSDVTPAYVNLEGFGSGKPIPTEQSLWLCLVCGRPECGFETGATIMREEDGQSKEDDPLEEDAATRLDENFEEESQSVQACVRGLLQSKKFFANNKYIGTESLDKKIADWLRLQLKMDATITERNWQALRRSAKETLRYKRQACTGRIRELYIGESLWCV